jgi:dolichol-phosphate mannosyltransferase
MAKNYDNVCLFLPTYNEAENVLSVVEDIQKHFSGFFFIVDGFSTDGTVETAEKAGIPVYDRTVSGKGSAIKKAMEIAEQEGKEFLLYMDCDRTYDAADIKKLLEVRDTSDLIYGVRPLENVRPYHRRLGNRVATGLINIMVSGNLRDSLSGFKCLRVSAFKHLLKEDGFVIDALIFAYALKYKLRISPVDVRYHQRVGSSKMSLAIGFIELTKLIKTLIRLALIRNKPEAKPED